jgi:hypothetical protein
VSVVSTPSGVTKRVVRRRAAFVIALWLGVSIAVFLVPGCYGRNCEGSGDTWGDSPNEGRMIDENTWESNAQDEKWLAFTRQRIYAFDLRALGGRTPQVILPYISANDDPNKTNNSFTIGSGNLAEIYSAHPDGVTVKNGTCSDYFLRLVVVASPLPPPGAAVDAGDAETPDGAQDAGSDGPDDAANDAGQDADAN